MVGILDLGEVGLNGSRTLGIAAHRIHCLAVDGPHLLCHGALLGIGGAKRGNNLFHAALALVVENVKLPVA